MTSGVAPSLLLPLVLCQLSDYFILSWTCECYIWRLQILLCCSEMWFYLIIRLFALFNQALNLIRTETASSSSGKIA